ncbi:hypothetical protein FB479_11662 [Brevibacillus sp. AG162]|uniref:major capsid protein n=1 Tax=Brevibacillus sp. AG162 TaxID=2572910 RepID=UPI0011533622|nr:major capsid protein [Brevibacillus sp. AG162]TQK41961.1 hypothetical protein FB479_11662 [Brevibacillus sp. AG162]
MAITRLADVIQPDLFTQYSIQRTTQLSGLIQSGIVQHDEQFDSLASGPNTVIDMPYFNDLTGRSENMVDDGFITPGKIGTGLDRAKKIARTRAWGANGLSAFLSGADPMGAIESLVASYWVREQQLVLISTLKGVFSSVSMNGHKLDITGLTGGAELLDGASFVDATQLLGDAKDIITGVMMHSAVEAYLVKRQLIEYVNTVNELNQPVRIPYFMNKRVIVDDAMPFDTSTKVASMYLFGTGAIALGNGSHPDIIQTEVDREKMSSSGEDFLITRRIWIMHPRGIKWTEKTIAAQFPTDGELETGANWELVYDPKKIRMVKFDFKIS